MTVARISLALALLFGGFAVAMSARMSNDTWGLSSLGFYAWLVAPYLMFFCAARFGRLSVLTKGALVLLILCGAYGSLAYADVNFHFWSKSDAQEALVFLVVPFSQFFYGVPLLGILAAIGAWLERRKEKGADRSAPSSDR